MDVIDAIDSMDDVLKLKCQKAIASIQRTLDLYGCVRMDRRLNAFCISACSNCFLPARCESVCSCGIA